MNGTHYTVLGVPSDASSGTIRKAYIALARRHHPDLNPGPERAAAQTAMQSVNEAWHILSDENRRRDYDTALMFERSAREQAAQRAREAPPAGSDPEWRPYDGGASDDGPTDARLDPRPIKGSSNVPRWITLAPAVVFVISLVVLAFGLLVASGDVLALGGVMLVFSVGGFILMPLVVMSRAERDPHL